MTTATTTDNTAQLLASATSMLGALAGAVDDLNRAALILRQESRTAAERFRSPEDMRRIASQFADRARECARSQEAALSLCRSIAVTTQA